MRLGTVQFLALVLTALMLVPSGAHLFALPNKIGLEQEPYFIVQGIYRGWALFGVVFLGALVANGVLAAALRGERRAYGFALLATLLILAMLTVFFTWTFPANQATANWTTVPANWELLRAQWEWSHVASAMLSFLAFLSTTLSVLTRK